MKKLLLFSLSLGLMMTSCSTSYYQLYKTSSTNNLQKQDSGLVYEDSNCSITYNMWSEGGSAGFKFYNKTSDNIYLNMEESFFILNGIAYNYFGNRVVTSSSGKTLSTSKKAGFIIPVTTQNYLVTPLLSIGTASSVGLSSSTSESVSYTEEKLVVIPAKSAKMISEYNINNQVIRNCDLLRYPSKRQIKPITFTSENSPVTFSNRISYRVGNGSSIKFENNFYISELTNYPVGEFFETKKEVDCEGHGKPFKSYKYSEPANFYLMYVKGADGGKY